MSKPIIAITMGDPASIGPEIAIKAVLTEAVTSICRPIVVGDAATIEDGSDGGAVELTGRNGLSVLIDRTVEIAATAPDTVLMNTQVLQLRWCRGRRDWR